MPVDTHCQWILAMISESWSPALPFWTLAVLVVSDMKWCLAKHHFILTISHFLYTLGIFLVRFNYSKEKFLYPTHFSVNMEWTGAILLYYFSRVDLFKSEPDSQFMEIGWKIKYWENNMQLNWMINKMSSSRNNSHTL